VILPPTESGTQSGIIISGVQNVGGVLSVYGTSGDDTILYNGEQNTLSFNGNLFSFDPSQISLLDFPHVWRSGLCVVWGPPLRLLRSRWPMALSIQGLEMIKWSLSVAVIFAAIQVNTGDDNDLVRYTGDTEVLLGYDGGAGDDTLDFSPNDQNFQISSSIINTEHTGVSFSNVERPIIHAQISNASFTVGSLAGDGEEVIALWDRRRGYCDSSGRRCWIEREL